MAIRHGYVFNGSFAVILILDEHRSADLVPVFSFGENDVRSLILLHTSMLIASQIYEQMPNERGTTVFRLQEKFKAVFGFTLPLFHGRGLLNCAFSCHLWYLSCLYSPRLQTTWA